MMSITLAIGIAGMLLILVAFFLNQIHVWRDTDFIYDFFNFIGGGLLVFYAYLINSWPFLFLNIVWTLVSIREVYLDIKVKKKHKAHIGHKRR